jgi:peptide/nickel transport system substrate-binding protein
VKRRFMLSLATAALGVGLLAASVAAEPASPTRQAAAKGGTYRVLNTNDFDHIDSALAYFSQSWNMEAATQLRLYYYPLVSGPRNQRIEPMAATGMPRVSNDGKTYTITVKPGFKFSNGANVTAANFKRAFDRAVNDKLQSPAESFLDDVASVRQRGSNTLVITLKRVAPDFVARITMPFFSAVLPSTPLDAEVTKGPLHSAGPYYIGEWNKGTSALAVRNPHWSNAREPFKSLGFANNVDRITWAGFQGDLATHRLQCERNEADWCDFPSGQAKELADKYGINKGRFYVNPDLLIWRVDLNNEQPLFKNNPNLRKAVLHALDRRFMTAQHGFLAGKRTDQNMPYAMPGFKEFDIYSLRGPNYARARQLAQGNLRGGKAVFYAFNRNYGPAVAQSVQFNLKQIGLDVEIKLFDRVVQNTKAATRGEPFDITNEGWHADYPDPANFVNVLLDGRRLQAENNVNTSYFSGNGVAGFTRKLDQAYRAAGAQRLNLYAQLDRDIMVNGAPSATYISGNTRRFFGPSVGCVGYNPQVGTILTSICKK